MKRFGLLTLLFCASIIFFSAVAFAKEIAGRVSTVDLERKKVLVTVTDELGFESIVDVWVNKDTQFSGCQALEDLNSGEKISTDAEEDSRGKWFASRIARL